MKPSKDNAVGRRLLKVKEAAFYLGISSWTVREQVRKGKLHVIRLADRGPWLLDIRELDQVIEGMKESIA